jgi:CDGSH-type Zn-finger protein
MTDDVPGIYPAELSNDDLPARAVDAPPEKTKGASQQPTLKTPPQHATTVDVPRYRRRLSFMTGSLLNRSGNVEARAVPAATVTVYPDGPLVVRGRFEVLEVDGTVVATSRVVALCRCGRSALKPLCDGSHKNRVGRVDASATAGHTANDYETPASSDAAG